MFRVPSAQLSAYHKAVITIDPLTPNFYPKIYLNKVELQYEPTNSGQLRFPNLVDNDLVFGENPFYQLNSNKFEYSFVGQASQRFVYYTMAVYQHTWGLTTYTKSEYQIRVTAGPTSSPVVASTRPELENGEQVVPIDTMPEFISG